MTVNCRPPMSTWTSGAAWPIPSRSAAVDPSTTAGKLPVAAFSQTPLLSSAPVAARRSVRAA